MKEKTTRNIKKMKRLKRQVMEEYVLRYWDKERRKVFQTGNGNQTLA
jgi:hypothetical protein